jgi:Pyridoxamine 5'-phosphate oxidase
MKTPTPESASTDELAALQALIDRSARAASPALADSVGSPDRQMRAAELLAFWRGTGLVAMATVGSAGQPHIAPVHAELRGTTLALVVYENTVRRRDLARNPRVAFTTWRDGAAVILYGRAREIPDSSREARPARSGTPRRVVSIEVALTRVHAMCPPPPRPADADPPQT